VQPSLLVTFDLGSVHYYNRMVLFNMLNGAVNRARIGAYGASAHGFTFRALEGKQVFEIVHICIFILFCLPHLKIFNFKTYYFWPVHISLSPCRHLTFCATLYYSTLLCDSYCTLLHNLTQLLHTAPCKLFHTAPSRLLHTGPCQLLHIAQCQLLHAVPCRLLNTAQCQLLHAVLSMPTTPHCAISIPP